MPNTSVPKRLALFFDGTDNTQEDNTNVCRAYLLVAPRDPAGVPQIKHYIKGVGTDVGHLARGSIFGTGIIQRICAGYRWLAENYVEGSEIYVFGFSRGAFAARSLVQLVANCGLPFPGALTSWTPARAFDRYEKISRQEREDVKPLWRLRYFQRHPEAAPDNWRPDVEESILLDWTRIQAVRIRMAGLWDTVGAIGTDAVQNIGAGTQKSAEHNVRPTLAQESGYHALAIDEHRPMFDATLWRRFVPDGEDPASQRYSNYEQRWFVGAHSDVGGGYRDGHLQDLSFEWMVGKASNLGLAFSSSFAAASSCEDDPIHDSFRGFGFGVLNLWNVLMPGDQRKYRGICRDPRRVVTSRGESGSLVTINETLDPSVKRRWANDPRYRSPSLVEYCGRNPSWLTS